MRGKAKIKKRELQPDLKYQNIYVSKLINQILRRGKKSIAQKIVYQAFDIIEQKTKKPGLEIFEQALENAGPPLEVRPRRVGGANYQVPMEVSRDRKITLAMRWIITAARGRQGKPMSELLSAEIIDAANQTGTAIKKREDMLRMAEANRAFAHFARM